MAGQVSYTSKSILAALSSAILLVSGIYAQTEKNESIHLLPLTQDDKVICTEKDGRIQINGTPTSAKWVGMPPMVYRLSETLMVVEEIYDGNSLYLWDSKTKDLIEIQGDTMPIGRKSRIIIQNDYWDETQGPAIYSINPETKDIEKLWHDTPGPKRYVEALGQVGDTLYFMVNRNQKETILTLKPGHKPAESNPFKSKADGHIAALGGDSVWKDQVLMKRLISPKNLLDHNSFQKPPVYEITSWDMNDETRRLIGIVNGGWMPKGGFPDPMLQLQWASPEIFDQIKKQKHSEAAQHPFFAANYLNSETLELISLGAQADK